MINLSLTQISSALRTKIVSVIEVLDKVIAQHERVSSLNAFISFSDKESLLQRACESQRRQDSGCLKGPLDGVPVVVKDNYCTSWTCTTCASNMLRNYTPPYDATLVTRLKEAGALIVGKSNMDEFGMGSGGVNSAFGATKNIFRSGILYTVDGQASKGMSDGSWLASGGSSSGSAVAVASGVAFCGLGSDTGGSIRAPASFCGLVGLKPSYGMLSRFGLISLVNSMDCPGVLTRTIDDCATVTAILAGVDSMDSTSVDLPFSSKPCSPSIEGLVVGVPEEYHCEGLHHSVIDCWRHVSDVLDNAGAKVIPVNLPHTAYAPSCYTVLNTAEVASNFTRFTGVQFGLKVECIESMEAQYALSRAAGLSRVVRDRILAGNYFLLRDNYEKYVEQAMKVRRLIADDFVKVFEAVDVLLTPTTLCPAPRPDLYVGKKYSELTYLQDLCTSPANLAGLPALALPVGYTANNSLNGRNSSNHTDTNISSNRMLDPALNERNFNSLQSELCEMTAEEVSGSEANIAGLPLSLQLIGQFGTERRLLEVGKWLEQSLQVPRIVFQDPS